MSQPMHMIIAIILFAITLDILIILFPRLQYDYLNAFPFLKKIYDKITDF